MYSHTATQQSQRLWHPLCATRALGVAARPLRRTVGFAKIMTKSIKALGGKGAPETILRRAQRAAASLNEAQTRADSLLTIPSLRLSRQPRAVPPGARESRKRGHSDLDAAAAPRPSHVTSEDPQPALAAATRAARRSPEPQINDGPGVTIARCLSPAPSTRRRPSRPAATCEEFKVIRRAYHRKVLARIQTRAATRKNFETSSRPLKFYVNSTIEVESSPSARRRTTRRLPLMYSRMRPTTSRPRKPEVTRSPTTTTPRLPKKTCLRIGSSRPSLIGRRARRSTRRPAASRRSPRARCASARSTSRPVLIRGGCASAAGASRRRSGKVYLILLSGGVREDALRRMNACSCAAWRSCPKPI